MYSKMQVFHFSIKILRHFQWQLDNKKIAIGSEALTLAHLSPWTMLSDLQQHLSQDAFKPIGL